MDCQVVPAIDYTFLFFLCMKLNIYYRVFIELSLKEVSGIDYSFP